LGRFSFIFIFRAGLSWLQADLREIVEAKIGAHHGRVTNQHCGDGEEAENRRRADGAILSDPTGRPRDPPNAERQVENRRADPEILDRRDARYRLSEGSRRHRSTEACVLVASREIQYARRCA
jgi:hypothetical protein